MHNPHERTVNFHVPYLVDETLREGIERTALPIKLEAKITLLKQMIDAGLRDFIVGCGPEKPDVWHRANQECDSKNFPGNTKLSFIILLNCWETAFNHFSEYKNHKNWIEKTTFSFGMITYKEKDKTFEKAITAFKNIGATHFKASILNNFRNGISEKSLTTMCDQIDHAASLGVKIIRINDSLGALQPHHTQWLCSRLVSKYPELVFCLHAHNDNGLALANAMQSIQSGFQMVEGSLAGLGNRSGITPIEQIINLCKKNNITLGDDPIDLDKIIIAARNCEQLLLHIPNVYRPVSGLFETDSNFGVLNIPDFLNTNNPKRHFVNDAGLHPETIKQALIKHYPEKTNGTNSQELEWQIINQLRREMESSANDAKTSYQSILNEFLTLYKNKVFTSKQLAQFYIEHT